MNKTNQVSSKFLGFVPALVIDYLFSKFKAGQKLVLPEKQSFHSVVMFADISGFTNLTEKLSKRGAEGAELIAFALNRYMELLVNAIGRSGGDIFKFAGDAMIVLWPPPKDNSDKDLTTLCRQAIQSALDIQARLNDTTVIEDIKLSVKIGFGIGEVTILHVGGVFSRAEYLAAGEPLLQAFEAEHCANSGGVIIISNQVWNKIHSYFEFRPVEGKHHHGGEGQDNGPFYYVEKLKKGQKVQMKADALLITNQLKPSDIEALTPIITPYMPAAVVPYLELDSEKWSAELRRLSVMFLNLGIDLSDAKTEPGLKRIQLVIETVQKCVYKYQGSLNKLLMDDKGSTLIVIFGLPPMAHQDDPVRATLTAIDLIKDLKAIGCACSVGITTGLVFAGVVGTSGNRREYSILGDSVNLAARLMQAACGEKQKKILVDEVTRKEAQGKLAFRFVRKAMVKGKSVEINFFEPITSEDEEFNVFPYNLRTHNNTPLKGEILNNEALLMVGKEREAVLKRTMEMIEKFIKKPNHNMMFLFCGMYGIGKSLMMRNIVYRTKTALEKVTWKNGENCEVLITNLNCATRERKLNGWIEILTRMLRLLSMREKKSYENLINILMKSSSDLSLVYSVIEKLLGIPLQKSNIKKSNMNLHLSDSTESSQIRDDKIIKKFISELFRKFTEDEQLPPITDPQKLPTNETFETMLERQEKKQTRSNNKWDIYPPLIIVLDDMQDFDVYSWKLTKRIIKQGSKVLIIGAVRTEFLELKPIFSRKKKSIDNEDEANHNEDVIEEGIFELEESLDNSCFQRVLIGEIDKEDIEVLLRKATGFGVIEAEEEEETTKIIEPMKWFVDYLANKTKGVPLFIINLIENLKAQNYIAVNENSHVMKLKAFLIKCIEINEGLTIYPPLGCQKINGPIIDHLQCIEIILLKIASVIGENFDFRSLANMTPLKKAFSNDKLLNMLDDLVRNEFLEILDENEGNIRYRMTHSFMRESLYHRMIYSQRRQLHRFVAETMQEVKPIKGHEVVDNLDCERLIYHWSLNENLNNGEEGNLFKIGVNFSSKAKRSVVVKKISSILSRNQRDFNVTLIRGQLEKKSDRGISWSLRYCVLNTKELKYFYTEENCKENSEEPLGSISLKHIYNIMPLDETVYKRKNAFIIYTGSWWKKHKEMGIRNFYFSTRTTDELEEWKTYIEFVRAKAIYDDFVNTFGKISFPLSSNGHEDLEFTKMSYKEGENKYNSFNFNETLLNRQTSHVAKSSFSRKTRKTIDSLSLQTQVQNKVARLKKNVRSFIDYSLFAVFSHIMQVASNACKGIERDDEELTLGKTNNIMKIHHETLDKMLEDKDDEIQDEKDKDCTIIRQAQERSPNLKRNQNKFHSNIVQNVVRFKKPDVRKQKSGSVILSSTSEIPSENFENGSPKAKDSPVQMIMKKMTYDVSGTSTWGRKETTEVEEDRERRNPKKSLGQKQMLVIGDRKGSLFVERKTSPFMDTHQKEQMRISGKKQNINGSDIKHLRESKIIEKSDKKHICVPQTAFSKVSIEFVEENEKLSLRIPQYDPFEGKVNYNYSLRPLSKEKKRAEKSNERIKTKTDECEKESNVFRFVGFALAPTISLRAKNNRLFEIKKGEPVSIRSVKGNDNAVECKYYERTGIFKKADFYFWENNLACSKNEEDIVTSPKTKIGPLKPNVFKMNQR